MRLTLSMIACLAVAAPAWAENPLEDGSCEDGARDRGWHRVPAGPEALESMSVCALGALYLSCERTHAAGGLSTGGIMECSLAYEVLKRRAFDGEWLRLRAWSERALGAWPYGGAQATGPRPTDV